MENKMKLQQLLSPVRKAIDDYNMIQEGDHIAIGISGGKDSLTLLMALYHLQKFYPQQFTLSAITIDLGYDQTFDLTKVSELCQQLSIPYIIEQTQIASIIFDERKEKNPCSLCGKMRKGALNNVAMKLGCNKVAYAHHKNDMIETMLLSMLFEGNFYSFPPVTMLDQSGLTIIRPLMYVDEADVIGFKNKYHLPVAKSLCPIDGHTKREYAKNLVKQLNKEHPGAKDRMFHAILNGGFDDWPEKKSLLK